MSADRSEQDKLGCQWAELLSVGDGRPLGDEESHGIGGGATSLRAAPSRARR